MSATDSKWVRKLESQLLGKKFLHIYHILCRVICIATLAVQLAILDYYLINFNSLIWLLWLIADIPVLVLFLFTIIVSYRYLQKRPIIPSNLFPRRYFGELPLTYVSWLVYSAILSAKVCCLYALPDSIALQLNEKYFFGHNMLHTAVSLASVVIYMLVLTSHDARSHSKQNAFIQTIVGSVYVDVLDTADFVTTLRDESLVIGRYHLDYVILVFACFNFILPTEGLYMLCWKHFGKVPVSPTFQFLHKVIYYVAVNLPFFIIRLLIWHLHDKHVSVFLVKNVLGVGLAVQHLHEVLVEVSHVFHLGVRSGGTDDDDADVPAQPGSVEMQQLATGSPARNIQPAETHAMEEIHSPQQNEQTHV